ncbi:unnamed protein product, partial [Laminaria digitata]
VGVVLVVEEADLRGRRERTQGRHCRGGSRRRFARLTKKATSRKRLRHLAARRRGLTAPATARPPLPPQLLLGGATRAAGTIAEPRLLLPLLLLVLLLAEWALLPSPPPRTVHREGDEARRLQPRLRLQHPPPP